MICPWPITLFIFCIKYIRDTALLLLLLLVFAIASSAYVLKKGIEDGKKSKYQLLLHCVLIVTSVIPPELPMQMALAVNSALITLMRMQIFCTEPFRVPLAGKVDVCLFDKTGTLTTDELVAVGVTDLKVRHIYISNVVYRVWGSKSFQILGEKFRIAPCKIIF